MKRVLISLAFGLLIIPLLMLALLIIKIISPTAYPMWIMWLFIWPYYVICWTLHVCVTAGKTMLVALVGHYLLFSFLIYICLSALGRLFKRRVRHAPPPAPLNNLPN